MNSTIILETDDGPYEIVVADLPTRPAKRDGFNFLQFDSTIANYLTTISMMNEMAKYSQNISANVLYKQFVYETDTMLDDIEKMVKENPTRYIDHYFNNELDRIEETEDITVIMKEAVNGER